MADQVTLIAEPRTDRGSGAARRLRNAGRIPAIAYGSGLDATAVSVDGLELYRALRTDAALNALIRLHIDGDVHLTLARELQRHPVRRDILHVDFVAVDRTKKVTVDVPIHLEGTSPGSEQGGVVDQVLLAATVDVLPLDVPDLVTLDISDMQIGDVKRLADLPLPEGVDLLGDPDRAIVSIAAPTVEEREEEAEVEGEAPSEEGAEEAAEAEEGAGE
jgi:large subunit ribosomal protein L25